VARILISADKRSVTPAEAAALYVEFGWGTAKRYSLARMKRALANCDIVVSARNGAGELVGIVRALTDRALDTKILDVIVVPEYQRQGVGRAMIRKIAALAKGTAIYGETEKKNFGFLEKCGFKKRGSLRVFVKR
jgi:ribosomal protein S18 acetylase RimI-like enzyme